MYKKYKLKRNKKKLISYYIVIFIAVFSIICATGYALLSDTLTISGNVTFSSDDDDDDTVVYGNSTYTYDASTDWIWGTDTEGVYKFETHINIVNLDEDFYTVPVVIEITFGNVSIDDFVESTNYNMWNAESVVAEGDSVTITLNSSSIWWPLNSSLDLYPMFDFNCHVPANTDVTAIEPLVIKSLSLNGRLCKNLTDGDSSTETETYSNSTNSSDSNPTDTTNTNNTDNTTNTNNTDNTTNTNNTDNTANSSDTTD